VRANLLVYWHLLFILATPGLVERIRKETASYAKEIKPESINGIFTAPGLKLDHEGLAKNCPLLMSTYLETLRLVDTAWSVRKTSQDVIIKANKGEIGFKIKKGEYITMPHDLHMMDPAYYPDPKIFNPERFLVKQEDGSLKTETGAAHLHGGGLSNFMFSRSIC
jgi:cytochrome P450